MRTLRLSVRSPKGAIVAIAALGLLLMSGRSHQAKAEDSHNLAEVKIAWLHRQVLVPSFELTWATEKFRAQRALAPNRDGRGGLAGRMGVAGMMGPIPSKDVRMNSRCSLLLDRGRFRFVNRGKLWHAKLRGYGETDTTVCWDGAIAHTSTQCPEAEVQMGKLRDGPDPREFGPMIPVLLAMRPQSELLPLDLDDYAFSDRKGDVDGCPCLVLERVRGERLTAWSEIWIDPAQEFVIRRIIRKGNRVRGQLDISYDRDSEKRLFPAQWRDTSTTLTGDLLKTSTSTVVRHTFSPEVEPSDFQLTFPVGTLVFDKRESHGEQYVVRPQGEKRMVLDAEIEAGITDDVMRATETGEPLREPASSR